MDLRSVRFGTGWRRLRTRDGPSHPTEKTNARLQSRDRDVDRRPRDVDPQRPRLPLAHGAPPQRKAQHTRRPHRMPTLPERAVDREPARSIVAIRSERPQIRKINHQRPRLMDTSRIDEVKAPPTTGRRDRARRPSQKSTAARKRVSRRTLGRVGRDAFRANTFDAQVVGLAGYA